MAAVLLVAVANVCHVPFRCGAQVLAGLDPTFTSDAWGRPSYLGAALARWLAGVVSESSGARFRVQLPL